MRFLLSATFALLLFFVSPAGAQVAESPEGAYSRGASAYFAGRTEEAEERLSQAIEFAPSDPRGYYLRGLNRLKQRDLAKARADLSEGARLEAQMGGATAALDRSLASVQGPARAMLERIRREARRNVVVSRRTAQAVARVEARREREQRVLRTTVQLPIEALASQLTTEQAQRVAIKNQPLPETLFAGAADSAVTEPVEEVDPFASPPAATASEPSEAMAAETDEADPFAENNDPFADDSTTPPSVAAVEAPEQSSEEPPAGSVEADIPEEARGSVSLGSLFSIFGRTASGYGKDKALGLDDKAKEGLSGAPMGGGPPGISFGEGDLGKAEELEGEAIDMEEAAPMERNSLERNGFDR